MGMRINLKRAACMGLLGVLCLGAKPSYDVYFIGNSLTRGLTLPDAPAPARLRELFQAAGHELNHGTQLSGGVNLRDHWNLAVGTINFLEVAINTTDINRSTYRDYPNALQGGLVTGGVATYGNYTWDTVLLQPYQSHVATVGNTMGDAEAINNFLRFATAANPSGSLAARQFHVYVAWPRLKGTGIEERAADPDGDGFYSYSEFYEAAYLPGASSPGSTMPNRDYMAQLMAAVPGAATGGALADPGRPVLLIPVATVLYELDKQIRADTADALGFAAHLNRNGEYFQTARFNSAASSHPTRIFYTDPSNKDTTWAQAGEPFAFVRAHGIKNIYADNVHMNDVPHGGPGHGTIGAYIAAATVVACITGTHPGAVTPDQVAAIYEQFDAAADTTLIATIQDTIWSVITATDPLVAGGPALAELTGVPAIPGDPDLANIFDMGRIGSDRILTFTSLVHTGATEVILETSPDLVNWSAIPLNILPATFREGIATYTIDLSGLMDAVFYRITAK